MLSVVVNLEVDFVRARSHKVPLGHIRIYTDIYRFSKIASPNGRRPPRKPYVRFLKIVSPNGRRPPRNKTYIYIYIYMFILYYVFIPYIP